MTRAKVSRKSKVAAGSKPATKEKFLEVARSEDTQPNLPKFEAKTQKQKVALAYLRSGKSITILRGSAGTGKSMVAVYHAATQLKAKKVDKIYLIRPAVSTGKSLGALPGTLEEKLAPYFAQTVSHFHTFMGKAHTDYCLRTGIIEMRAVEYLRGASLENCIVIFEESQNFSWEDWKMVITRLGENAQFIFTGDEQQNDLNGRSGLSATVDMIAEAVEKEPDYLEDEDLNHIEDGIGVVTFLPEDVVRSGLTRALVKLYYYR